LNWDNLDHRRLILAEPAAIAEFIKINQMTLKRPIIVFDELHKYRNWKIFLKGFFDAYRDNVRIIVTGISKLDIYRTGGDNLMGRYFSYQIHLFFVAECIRTKINEKEISFPQKIDTALFDPLFKFGGFPEPLTKHHSRFSNRWKKLRKEQLFREDIRDLSRIQEIGQLKILAQLLKYQAWQLINYNHLANKINVSVDTIKRWINTLNAFYYCCLIQP